MTSKKIDAQSENKTPPFDNINELDEIKKQEFKNEVLRQIVHKINNPLTLIVVQAELLETYLESGTNLEQSAALAKKIREAAFHISKILSDFPNPKLR